MMQNKYLFLFVTLLLTINLLTAQSNLFLDNSFTVEEMVEDFFDSPNITTSNITFTGSLDAVSFFDAGGTDLEIGAGIVLSTGLVTSIPDENTTNNASDSFNTSGDSDIETLIGNTFTSNDAAVIEFDFTVSGSDSLNFNFIFGSEEYPEFVCSFNDAFGFFVSGPGIDGPYSNNALNISTIPNTDAAVSINNVNNIPECGDPAHEIYYVNNSQGQHVIFDGLTVSLPASFYAVGGETYHAKIVVADVGDAIFDSGVFLSFEGLGSDDLLEPQSEFEFVQDGNTLNFDNSTKYARSWHWNFGNGQSSTQRNPEPVEYLFPGTYDVQLITENFCCVDTFSTQVVIQDGILTTEINITEPSCFGFDDGSVELNITGGTPPYTIESENILEGPLPAGFYEFTVTDVDGITFNGNFTIDQPAPIILTINTTLVTDADSNGSASVFINSGGAFPFTYEWSNGATTPTIENIPAGDYSVTVTDANGCANIISTVVESITGVHNVVENSFLNLFPNPVANHLFIENNSSKKLNSLQVFNILGQSESIDYDVNGAVIEIQYLNIAPGVYTIALRWADEKISSLRFVKR